MANKFLGEAEGVNTGEHALVKKDQFWTRQQKFTRSYLVVAESLATLEASVIQTTGLPPLGALLAGTLAFCINKKGKEIMRVKHPTTGVPTVLWEVAADFDSDIDADENDQPPEARTPKIRWFGEQEEEVLEKDAIEANTAIETVPGEPIIITAPVVRPVLEVKRFELPPFDPDTILDYANHVNSATFYGAPEGTALMLPMETQEVNIEGTKYIEATYRVKFKIIKEEGDLKMDSWKANVLHHGFRYFPEVGQPARVYTDERENPATINLAADGTQLAEGADPVFLQFNKFPKVNFNLLNLGPF